MLSEQCCLSSLWVCLMFQKRLITVTSEIQQTDVLHCRCRCEFYTRYRAPVSGALLNRLSLEDGLGWWSAIQSNPNQSVYPVGKWQEVQSTICDGKKKGPLAYVLKSALAPLTSFVSAFLAWLDALMPLLLLAYFSIEPCCLNLSGGRKRKNGLLLFCVQTDWVGTH